MESKPKPYTNGIGGDNRIKRNRKPHPIYNKLVVLEIGEAAKWYCLPDEFNDLRSKVRSWSIEKDMKFSSKSSMGIITFVRTL